MQKLIDGVWHTRDSIVEQYAGLVYQQARSLSKVNKDIFDDLTQEGFYGLILAFDRYELASGNKFITLAHDYVRGWMLNYMRRTPIFSGVTTVRDATAKINKADAWLWDDAEIVDKLGLSMSLVRRVRLFATRQNTISLDFVGMDDKPLNEIIGYTQDFTDIDIELYAPGLNQREQFILRKLRQGYSLREISDMLNLSRSRAGQILQKIKTKIPEESEWR